MKNSLFLAVVVLVAVACLAVGFIVSDKFDRDGYQRSNYYERDYRDKRYRNNRNCQDGYNYNGMWLDVQVRPDGTVVDLNRSHLYKMGYHDGYYGHHLNRSYTYSNDYNRGYEQGRHDRSCPR